MRASDINLLKLIRERGQFIVPIYQRSYIWGEPECKRLWDDILKAGKKDVGHFVGAITYVQDKHHISTIPKLLLIDGQQRLATIMLLIEALARQLENGREISDISPKQLRAYYLLNEHEKGESRFKLLLSQTDKQTLIDILEHKNLADGKSIRIRDNFSFFEGRLGSEIDIETVWKGLTKLMVIDVGLEEREHPQLIFESLNATGKRLTQADLIRNFVLMDLDRERQEKIYQNYWQPMEKEFGQIAYAKQFDRFMRDYLTVKMSLVPKIDAVYEEFKRYSEIAEKSVEDRLKDLQKFAQHYCAIALGKEKCPNLAKVFQELQQLRVDVAMPLLLVLYDSYKKEDLTAEELQKATRYIESYVFRRSICDIPTNSLQKTFATFERECGKESGTYIEKIERHFCNLDGYRQFPRDKEFKERLMDKNLDKFQNKAYLLRKLENYGRKELISDSEYSVEHIMPQSLSDTWKRELGEDWEEIYDKYLHTIGNLTLTRYNSEYGNKPFATKRGMKDGFLKSPLYLNETVREEEVWNKQAIMRRAKNLAEQAVKVWAGPPNLSDVPQVEADKLSSEYKITNYPALGAGSLMLPVFEELHKGIRNLHPYISRKFLKQYIAYNVHTNANFVSVIPQQQSLKLILYMKYHDIHDPQGKAINLDGKGHWGRGDTQLSIQSLEEISYAISLVQQALDQQLAEHD